MTFKDNKKLFTLISDHSTKQWSQYYTNNIKTNSSTYLTTVSGVI